MSTSVLKAKLRSGVIGVALVSLVPLSVPFSAWADQTDDIVKSGISRAKSAAASQKRIDKISEDTEKVISKYHQQRKSVEVLKKFNDRLRRTLSAQEVAMGKLERSIEDASLIERQIVPLMLRMISGLDTFIASDIPFKLEERKARVERIRGYLTNANIAAAERFRQVLDAYSTESNYGKTIDVYSEELDLNGAKRTVNVLQVGRAGLYYQTIDGNESGYWDKSDKQWKTLDSSHNEGITKAIKISQGKASKGLMTLPIIAPEKV